MQYFWRDNSLNSLKLDWLHFLERVISHRLYNKTLRKNCVWSVLPHSLRKNSISTEVLYFLFIRILKRIVVESLSCVRHFCDPMDCIPPGSTVRAILQARILAWVAISSSRGSYLPKDRICITCVSCIGRQILATEPPGKPQNKEK